MFYSREELKSKAQEYCKRNQIEIIENLGFGLQGVVFATNRQSAVKVHAERIAFLRELHVYRRLAEFDLQQINDFIIPALLGFDDNSLIIEMSLVSPPFIVDFGGAYLDKPPAHAIDETFGKTGLFRKRNNSVQIGLKSFQF